MPPSPEEQAFYRRVMTVLRENGIPHLAGGAYAFGVYTGIARDTKDFDLFVKPADFDRIVDAFAKEGCTAERTFPHWLGKIHHESGVFVDFIYRSNNGVSEVDDEWFRHAVESEIFGMPVMLCAPEEILLQKMFVQERDRFDGADVNHLILAKGKEIDWDRLVRRFSGHWRVLLAHLVLFGFAYPSERDAVPRDLLESLARKLLEEKPASEKLCNGTLLARGQYLVDVRERGFIDGCLPPRGNVEPEHVKLWDAWIDENS